MNLETSKKVLKIAGICEIIIAVIILILGVLAMIGGNDLIGDVAANSEAQEQAALAIGGGVILAISGVLSIIEGIISYQAGKTGKKKLATVAMVLAALSTISSITGLFSGNNGGASNIVSTVVGIALNVLVAYAAYVVRQAAQD
ncbi:MAG: hypothetical protein K6A70_02220 [Erysipelotrichaceae bacterium]|nr:hypothetical protein [Erysipelotrichaceae bacterium]